MWVGMVVGFIIGFTVAISPIVFLIIPKKEKELTKEEWKAGIHENNTL